MDVLLAFLMNGLI